MKNVSPNDLKAVRAYFKVSSDFPIIDAKQPFEIRPTQSDFEKARRKDWGQCVFAQSAMRIAGQGTLALIFVSVAYFLMKDRSGRQVIHRYIPGADARRAIGAYDKTGRKPDIGCPYVFLAPSESQKAGNRGATDRTKLVAKRGRLSLNLQSLKSEKEALNRTVASGGRGVVQARERLRKVTSAIRTTHADLGEVIEAIAEYDAANPPSGKGRERTPPKPRGIYSGNVTSLFAGSGKIERGVRDARSAFATILANQRIKAHA
jgi:hypothetical protein